MQGIGNNSKKKSKSESDTDFISRRSLLTQMHNLLINTVTL